MIVKLKITPSEKKSYFFIIPKKHVRLAVLRNTIKRHVRELTQNLTAKIIFRVNASVTKKNLTEVLVELRQEIRQKI